MSPAAVVRAAVLGSPIRHSKSPQLHAAAYQFLELDTDYSRVELTEGRVAEFLHAHAADFTGFSVTMPLKSVMVQQMTTISGRVAALGALNTITVEPAAAGAPALHGDNTDVDGITEALRVSGVGAPGPAETGPAETGPGDTGTGPARMGIFAVIGAGSTAAAALAAAADLGFTRVRIYVRSLERGVPAAELGRRLGLEPEIRELEQLPGDLADDLAGQRRGPRVSAVVSTLPPRAADPLAGRLAGLTHAPPLLDVAYDPWPSVLATSWQAAGGPVVSGLEMLLHQAVKQVELFTACTGRPAAQLSPGERAELVSRMRAAVEL